MSEQTIQMSYPDMAEMSKSFQAGTEQLMQTHSQMKSIAGDLSGGVLLGAGGSAFTEAIDSRLCKAIENLAKKFDELREDVNVAVREMQEADQESKAMF